jgi:large subunit ribosomal protein L4
MQADVKTLSNEAAGSIELPDAIFGLKPRPDVLHRVVTWQLAKRRAGTHKAKPRSEVNGSGRKIWRQKGTGRARHGNKKAPQFRGGGVAFGPLPRDHAIKLPKKIRRLGLMNALSAKQAAGELLVLDTAALAAPRTKDLLGHLARLGLADALIIDGPTLDENFARAARNVPGIDVLPSQGANVYDILRRRHLVLTKAAVAALQERLA